MAIKSAYELAMERMGASRGPSLTDAQKKQLAELEQLYKAKIAEEELALQPKIVAARAAGQLEEAEQLQQTLQAQLAKLRAKLEEKKEEVRQGTAS